MAMRLFNFNPADYAERYAGQGYVHVPGGLTPDFLDLLAQQVHRHLAAHRLRDWEIGDKQQGLYEFPDGGDGYGELMSAIGAVTGLDPRRLALSERHIKAYEPDADPNPQPHKDRYASQVSVGLSVSVPPGSRLVLYPHDDVWVNPYNTAARLRASMTESPAERVRHARKVVIEDKPGDVLIFKGNAIWHLRENPANTTNVYLKLNDFNCDPLAEDPHTDTVRRRSVELLGASDAALGPLVPLVGRRVDYFNRPLSRDGQEAHEVVLWGGETRRVSERELAALRQLDWDGSVASLVKSLNGGDEKVGFGAVRRLVESGVVDLFETARG
jgi:hypothetical protein